MKVQKEIIFCAFFVNLIISSYISGVKKMIKVFLYTVLLDYTIKKNAMCYIVYFEMIHFQCCWKKINNFEFITLKSKNYTV